MRFYTVFFFIFISHFFYAQNTLAEAENIYHVKKSLQFGEDFSFQNEFAIEVKGILIPNTTNFTINYNQKYLIYDPVRDPKRLLLNTGLFMGTALVSYGVLWVLPESFTGWDKEEMLEYGMWQRWRDNVTAGPVWDEDVLFLNWITHPWAGAVYFMSARGSGFNKWESFAYSALMSTFFWEYGVEAFAEVPSWQDLIITPVLGSVLGELFFNWKGNIIKNERKVLNSKVLGGVSLFIMDPFNMVIDGLGYKTKHKMQAYSTIAPIDYDFRSGKTIFGLQIVVAF